MGDCHHPEYVGFCRWCPGESSRNSGLHCHHLSERNDIVRMLSAKGIIEAEKRNNAVRLTSEVHQWRSHSIIMSSLVPKYIP